MTTNDYRWLPMTTNDYQWLLMTIRWLCNDYPMTIWWLSNDYPMTFRWLSDNYPMTIRQLSDDYPMTTDDYLWLPMTTDDYPMTMQWLSDDYQMTIRWLYDDYPLTIQWLSRTFDLFFLMIIDLKRSIDGRWLFKSGATFILRWSCCPVKVVTQSENVTPMTWVVSPNFWVKRCRCLGSESRGNNRVWKLVRRWWLNQRSNCAQSRLPNWT